MECIKCKINIDDDQVFVLKRGEFENKPLCESCFKEEKSTLYGDHHDKQDTQ